VLYLRTLRMCLRFVLILPLGSNKDSASRCLCAIYGLMVPLSAKVEKRKSQRGGIKDAHP